MTIEFTWCQLLIFGVAVMTLAWTIVVKRRCASIDERARAVPSSGERFFWNLVAGIISGSLLAYGIGALLPTYVILDCRHDDCHCTRYVLDTSTFTDEMLGIYVVNRTAATVSVECEEYRKKDEQTRWSRLGILQPGQKLATKQIPEYFFEGPSGWDVSWFDLGIHRVYYCLEYENE